MGDEYQKGLREMAQYVHHRDTVVGVQPTKKSAVEEMKEKAARVAESCHTSCGPKCDLCRAVRAIRSIHVPADE